MKKILLRLLSLTLALLFAAMSLAACGKKGDDEGGDEDSTVTTEETDKSNVPSDLKFEGGTVNVLIPSVMAHEFIIDDADTNIINAAIRKVKNMTEERLGCTVNYIELPVADSAAVVSSLQKTIANSILAGDNSYDVIANVAHASIGHITQGYYYNFNSDNEKNYVDTSYSCYNQEFVNNVSYKGKIYALVGDYTIGFTDRTPVMFYNEDKVKDQQITDDIVQKVLDGEWTIEYLRGLVTDVYEEMDGAEGQTKGDYYGLFYNCGSMCNDAQIYAAGVRISRKNADNSIELSWTEGNSSNAFEAVYNLIYKTTGVFVGTVAGGTYYGENDITSYYSEQAFYEQRAMFAYGMLSAAKTFALDSTLNYGILPLPKYVTGEEQSYSTTPQNGYGIIAVPYNVGSRLGIATATLQILSEYSYKELCPVYYETAYKVRYASSEKTGELFDMIMDSIGIDFASFYNSQMGKPVEVLRNRLDGLNGATVGSSLTGVVAQNKPAVNKGLKDLLKSLDEIEN